MKKQFSILLMLLVAALPGYVQTITQWRGVTRDGIYHETNLLKTWPENGPELKWAIDSLGNGFASPVVTNDRIYIPGEVDSTGYLFAFDKQGGLIWKQETGKEWTENFPGPRSTPTVVDNLIYYCSSMGEVICMDAANGQRKWSVNMLKDLHGINVRFGYTESPLIDGDRLFCFPGGRDTNVVALNRFTGKMIWKSKAMADSASYCSPMMIRLPANNKILVTLMIHHLIGVDAATGDLLWSYPFERPGDIHCNTPVYEGGFIYYDDRGGNGIVKLELSPDGKSIREVWRNFKGGNVQGGSVKIGEYLYGSRYRPARFESVVASTGVVADSVKFNCGSTIFADDMLYCYNDQGVMGLIKPNQGKPEVVSTFKITEGTLEHFAHPVICDGVLYIRHGNVLLAYDILKKQPK
ncbi:MAG: PQQ-binding-like beta-propeller repeat protein [Bacteroidetes bacterium]|nr:PQQ-binding-like beta-propeller repeat protein [Bacteroidota bacterium]